jgi:hypothetical protein
MLCLGWIVAERDCCAPNCAPYVPLLCPTTFHDVFGNQKGWARKYRKKQVMRGGDW